MALRLKKQQQQQNKEKMYQQQTVLCSFIHFVRLIFLFNPRSSFVYLLFFSRSHCTLKVSVSSTVDTLLTYSRLILLIRLNYIFLFLFFLRQLCLCAFFSVFHIFSCCRKKTRLFSITFFVPNERFIKMCSTNYDSHCCLC